MAIDNVMQCECVFVVMSSKPLRMKINIIKIMDKQYYKYFHYYHNEQHAKLPNIVTITCIVNYITNNKQWEWNIIGKDVL